MPIGEVAAVIGRTEFWRLPVYGVVVLMANCLSTAEASCGDSEAPLQLYFNDRPPYMTSTGGEIHGLVADVVNRVLQQADIRYQWIALPSNRHLLMLEHSKECGCAVGWYQLPERQQFAQFSRPLYRDSASIAVVRADFVEPAVAAFSYWLQQPSLRVLTKQRYSYGPYLDELLINSKAQRHSSTEETEAMLQQLLRNNADVVFLSADEALWQIGNLRAEQRLRVVQFIDAPATRTRHLMCNYVVPDPLLQKINAQLPDKL